MEQAETVCRAVIYLCFGALLGDILFLIFIEDVWNTSERIIAWRIRRSIRRGGT